MPIRIERYAHKDESKSPKIFFGCKKRVQNENIERDFNINTAMPIETLFYPISTRY